MIKYRVVSVRFLLRRPMLSDVSAVEEDYWLKSNQGAMHIFSDRLNHSLPIPGSSVRT
jgi:hypothetical protein